MSGVLVATRRWHGGDSHAVSERTHSSANNTVDFSVTGDMTSRTHVMHRKTDARTHTRTHRQGHKDTHTHTGTQGHTHTDLRRHDITHA